jgi:hypothetical protein
MNRAYLLLPIAAVLTMSISACGRNEDRTTASNPELPRTAQAPSNSDRPAAGTPVIRMAAGRGGKDHLALQLPVLGSKVRPGANAAT